MQVWCPGAAPFGSPSPGPAAALAKHHQASRVKNSYWKGGGISISWWVWKNEKCCLCSTGNFILFFFLVADHSYLFSLLHCGFLYLEWSQSLQSKLIKDTKTDLQPNSSEGIFICFYCQLMSRRVLWCWRRGEVWSRKYKWANCIMWFWPFSSTETSLITLNANFPVKIWTGLFLLKVYWHKRVRNSLLLLVSFVKLFYVDILKLLHLWLSWRKSFRKTAVLCVLFQLSMWYV